MIRPKEIQQKAREAGARDQQIEKDYILSWILKGIADTNFWQKFSSSRAARFFGKFRFKDNCFSEYLAFTLIDTSARESGFADEICFDK